MGKTVEFKVVGVSFREIDGVKLHPQNLLKLAALHEERQLAEIRGETDEVDIPLTLVRDPANPHDPNAVEVHAPVLGRGDRGWVGFVPAWLAAKLAPSMDRGDVWEARLDRVLISPDSPENPGAQVIMERTLRVAEVPA